MTKVWAIVGLMWVLALLVGNTRAVSLPDEEYLATDEEYQATIGVPFAEPRVDLYGNEISDAVGDYRVDRGGDLYERHAPDTAVLRLGPPGV